MSGSILNGSILDGSILNGSILNEKYRIDALIDSGGMGHIYRGEHLILQRRVAIKVLRQDLYGNREATQRFLREAIASGRLDHLNIVNIHDFDVLPNGACYLVMELLEGETLGARLEREGRIPWHEALNILRGVHLGLRHAHDRGVVHRDIKPDNIYLACKDSEVIPKILDFGAAKLRAGTNDDPAATRAGLTIGTPAYLSPEQAVGGEITPASDCYSATIVLYEMIAGRAPFEDKDPLAMLGAHVSRIPPPLAETAPGVEIPPEVEAMIQAGLVKAPADRIQSADDYISLLDRVIASAQCESTAPVVAAPTEHAFSSKPSLAPGSTDLSMIITIESCTVLPDGTMSVAPSTTHELPPQAHAVSLSESVLRWLQLGSIVVVLIVGVVLLILAVERC